MLFFQSFIYFFSYTRSLKCGQLQELKNLSGVYVNCYRASIYIVADRCLLYSKTSRQIGAVEALLPSVNKHKNH